MLHSALLRVPSILCHACVPTCHPRPACTSRRRPPYPHVCRRPRVACARPPSLSPLPASLGAGCALLDGCRARPPRHAQTPPAPTSRPATPPAALSTHALFTTGTGLLLLPPCLPLLLARLPHRWRSARCTGRRTRHLPLNQMYRVEPLMCSIIVIPISMWFERACPSLNSVFFEVDHK